MRRSRARPYELHVRSRVTPKAQTLALEFRNTGRAGAVFHVYDKQHLEHIPRRYTVEPGKALTDAWTLAEDKGRYDLWVCAPNGFLREFRGNLTTRHAFTDLYLEYDLPKTTARLIATNHGARPAVLTVSANAYRTDGPWPLQIAPAQRVVREWPLISSHGWYDLTVKGDDFERRFAGRMETGKSGFSDPAV